jgi:hypothetical protein
MTPKCTPILGIAFVQELRMFKALVGKENKHQIRPLRHHLKSFEVWRLNCPQIVHLNLFT